MNTVQSTYTPPRFVALLLGTLIFVAYQFIRRPMLATDATQGDPLPMIAAVGMSLLMGYGVTMLG